MSDNNNYYYCIITSTRRYPMRPRRIGQTLDGIDAGHEKAPSTFEHSSFAIRIIVLDHDQSGVVHADRRTFDHDAVRR